jgi:hypothetical protein
VIKGLSQVGAQNVKHGLRTCRHGTSETIQCVHRADAHRRQTMPKQFNCLGRPIVLGSVPIWVKLPTVELMPEVGVPKPDRSADRGEDSAHRAPLLVHGPDTVCRS